MTREETAILRRAASIWGRLGGSVTSPAKAKASRLNGKKGGRPGCGGCAYYTGKWPCKKSRMLKHKCPYHPARRGRGGEKPPATASLERNSPREARPSKQKK